MPNNTMPMMMMPMMGMNGMNMMPQTMPMMMPMPMMCTMTCEMSGNNMVCTMTPMGNMTAEMMKECCERLTSMMQMGMPVMMMCGNMYMCCCPAEAKK